ncbi:MAG TPA: ABC transporter ATP-binding protein [Gemmataceae bacterium]|nr:ABC transporter ATP-binding protein [Gemmataceae bacterium]
MIVLENVTVRAGAFCLAGVNLTVPTGGYAALMGKTGSGKTTLLEAICGLKPVTAGRVLLLGQDVTRRKPAERGIGYVPQDRALFPTMTVEEHLAFALIIRRWDRRAIERRVGELAELLGLEKLLGRRPRGLSGGEAQRVALGRALAFHPQVLLLDEPLSALDEETREEMYGLLRSVRERTGVTTLHVTHNLHEAHRLADTVFLLKDGIIRQEALPDRVMPPVGTGGRLTR